MQAHQSHLCGAGQGHVSLAVSVPAALAGHKLASGGAVGRQALAQDILDVHDLQVAKRDTAAHTFESDMVLLWRHIAYITAACIRVNGMLASAHVPPRVSPRHSHHPRKLNRFCTSLQRQVEESGQAVDGLIQTKSTRPSGN